MAEPPRKPEQQRRSPSVPGVRNLALPPLPTTPPPADGFEHFARLLREQTDAIVTQVNAGLDDVRAEARQQFTGLDARVFDLEKSRLEQQRMNLAVETLTSQQARLTGAIEVALASDRVQNMDIGALKAALKPTVVAEANDVGTEAGHLAGKRTAKLTSALIGLATLVLTVVVQHCQQQLENYNSATAPAASSK